METKTTEDIYYDSLKHTGNRMLVCNRKECGFCDEKWVRVSDIIKRLEGMGSLPVEIDIPLLIDELSQSNDDVCEESRTEKGLPSSIDKKGLEKKDSKSRQFNSNPSKPSNIPKCEWIGDLCVTHSCHHPKEPVSKTPHKHEWTKYAEGCHVIEYSCKCGSYRFVDKDVEVQK